MIVNTANLITSGKLQNDCDDIRITNSTGNTVVPYWIEEGYSGCNTTITKIWTKLSSIPIDESILFLYYGNASGTNAQNGESVFAFFDDFNDGSIDTNKWNETGVGGTIQETGGYIHTYVNNNTKGFSSKSIFSSDVTVEFRLNILGDRGCQGHLNFGLQDSTATDFSTTVKQANWSNFACDGTQYFLLSNGTQNESFGMSVWNSWTTTYQAKSLIKRSNTNGFLELYEPTKGTASKILSTFPPTGNLVINFTSIDTSTSFGGLDTWVYWVFAREYSAIEPVTLVNFLNEETN